MLKIEYRVLSEPAVVWWVGFRSDTLKLQQAGWELAADQDVMENRIRLLLRHRDMELYALTNDVEYGFRRDPRYDMARPPLEFRVVMASPQFQIQRVGHVVAAFQQIDAKPQWQTDVEIKTLDDFKIFATPLVRTEEIIVDPLAVSQMLERIREMQVPEQERIRQKKRLEEARERHTIRLDSEPRTQFHAQIVSIVDHRKAA